MLRNILRYSAAPMRAMPIATRSVVSQSTVSSVRFYSEAAKKEGEGEAAKEEGSEEAHPLQKALDECQTKLEEKDKQLVGFKDKYLRSIADFQNLQNRTAKEVADAKSYALRKFAKDLLESVDNFDRALSVVDADKKQDPVEHKELIDLYEGIKMTQQVFEKTLAKHGITKVNPVGEKFDPNVHEAIFQAPQQDKEPGSVFVVQQTGFIYNGKVLRAAKVGVVLEQ